MTKKRSRANARNIAKEIHEGLQTILALHEVASPAVVQITARIPFEMHERIRLHTFKTRESINSMILRGLEQQLQR